MTAQVIAVIGSKDKEGILSQSHTIQCVYYTPHLCIQGRDITIIICDFLPGKGGKLIGHIGG